MALKPIQILINAKDNASGVFDKLQSKIGAVGAAIAGYFSIRAFAGVVSSAADFEAAMSRVQAATGASADEMRNLRAAAENAADGTKFSAIDTAAALENLAKAGLDTAQSIEALPAAMALAQAGDIDLGQSAEYVTKAVMGMGLSFSDAARVADVLALGANATNTSVEGLAQALSYAAPVANSLGVSLESTVAIIGKFADAGIDASRAGTALNSILSQFSNPATKFRQELAAAGITTTNFEDALHQLAAAGPAGERAINAIGQEAGPALRALLNQGMGSLDELTVKLGSAAGSADEVAAAMRNNLNGALASLRGAWEGFTRALGTPVLPVVQQAVDRLAGALRSAVADGTVTKFGQALATAFQGAVEWARNFIATVDLQALTQRLQTFAGEAQSAFQRVGEWASNAGNIVKTAYGVMSGGVNVVLTAVYGIGSVFAEVASTIMAGVARLRDGLASITFGSLSESFRLAAEDARESSGAFGAVADAMREKAASAFQDVATSATMARDGFWALADGAEESAQRVQASASAFGAVATQLQATAAANAKAAEESRKTAAAHEEQAAKAQQAKAAQEALRAEYAQAIAVGNVQRAAELIGELKKASDASAAAAKGHARAQQEAAAEIAAAFERAGIQTKDSLKVAASTALRDFELVRDSGKATASGIAEAWKRAADAAITAGDGVAPAWVKAQASAQGYALALDKAGKATLQIAQGQDLEPVVQGWNNATAAAQRYAEAVERIAQAGGLNPGEVVTSPDGSTTLMNASRSLSNAKSTQKSGETRTAGTDLGSLTGIAAFLKAAGVKDEAAARRIAKEFADANGNVQYFNSPGQMKYGGKGGTLSQALLKAAESYTFSDEQLRPAVPGGDDRPPASIPKPENRRTFNISLQVDGRDMGNVDTSQQGAAALEGFLNELQRARSTSSGVH